MFLCPIFYSDTKLSDRFIFQNKRFIFWFLQKRRGLCCPNFIPKSVSSEFQVFLQPEILFFTEKSFYIIGNCSAAHGPKRLEISRNCLHELRAEALGFFNIIETSATLCVIQNTKYMYRFTIFIVVLGKRWINQHLEWSTSSVVKINHKFLLNRALSACISSFYEGFTLKRV